MKKFLFWHLLALLLACSTAALANGWGAPGDTVSIFTGTDTYNDYTVTTHDYSRTRSKTHMVVENRYHQQLLVAEKLDDRWQVILASTKALWQPDDPQTAGPWPRIEWEEGGFILRYPDEYYHFDEELFLQEAQCGSLTFTYNGEDAYLVEDGQSSALWQVWGGLFLPDFNIRLMPRSLDEIAHLNTLCGCTLDLFQRTALAASDESFPVYSMPGDQSWRAAKGKASASLKDSAGLYAFGLQENGWTLIQYQVSNRTSRVGYIHNAGNASAWNDGQGWQLIPVTTAANTWLTDDPDVSQFPQAQFKPGAAMTLLGRWGLYGYVETSVDGKPARGFVPLRDLKLRGDLADTAALDLPGRYRCIRGGSPLGLSVTFHDDGSFAMDDGPAGQWSITGAQDSSHLLQLNLIHADGQSEALPLTLRSHGLSVSYPDFPGGDYIRE